MPRIDTYRKQAKLLVCWHCERNYSAGEKVRLLERFQQLSDAAILDMPMPLALAQEIVAVEAGFGDWAELKAASDDNPRKRPALDAQPPRLRDVVPILFVSDVSASAAFFRDRLGFAVDFLHGQPAFYGAVSRDNTCVHLRYVCRPNFAELARQEQSLILASFEVSDVKALFDEIEARGAEIRQKLTRQAWGGLDFHVRDPDGNVISFVQYHVPTAVEAD